MTALPPPTLARVTDHRADLRWPLHSRHTTRQIEAGATGTRPDHSLMQAAGLAAARLALAVAPPGCHFHAVAGNGNNGGDAITAATALRRMGQAVAVHLLGDGTDLPHDAARALREAQAAGVAISHGLPRGLESTHWVIDGILGLGCQRPVAGLHAEALRTIASAQARVLALDLPSGLDADSGQLWSPHTPRAAHTLSLLTLKPGLFTGHGRGRAGTVWFCDLGGDGSHQGATAWLQSQGRASPARTSLHEGHKGLFGQVLMVGGAPGMAGAAQLAGYAALSAGAGRVWISSPGEHAQGAASCAPPELMHWPYPRSFEPAALDPAGLSRLTVVCGCGGGPALAEGMNLWLTHITRLVLDADALNAIAQSAGLQGALVERSARGFETVLTPHPLEAARMLGCTVDDIQADRLSTAQALADRFACVCVLKGSGTVIAAPGELPTINHSGNAALATAGTGDVLAGWLGGLWAQQDPATRAHSAAYRVACDAVWQHGHAADLHQGSGPLLASDLIRRLQSL